MTKKEASTMITWAIILDILQTQAKDAGLEAGTAEVDNQ